MSSAELYDERYRGAYMDAWPAWKRSRLFELVRSLGLPRDGQALDYGCGAGALTAVLCEALPGWSVWGTDLSAVALAKARAALPGCRFEPASELRGQRFDFVLTHHVLEHVDDLGAALAVLEAVTGPGARALHVLPCGNPGSWEHRLCELRDDGHERDGRFFLDEPGHLRRLTTQGLARAANAWVLERERYACHRWGSIEWITAQPLAAVRALADPRRGRTRAARARLHTLRSELVAWTLARRPEAAYDALLAGRHIRGSSRVRQLLVPALAPLARRAEQRLLALAEHEWRTRGTDPRAAEMYLCFRRPV